MLRQTVIEDTIIDSINIIFDEKIEEIILSNPKVSSIEMAYEKYGDLEEKTHPVVKQLLKYFNKEEFKFNLDDLNLSKCSDFQRKVLKIQFETPLGQTNHYKDIAIKIHNPKSSRAVGNALRNNPFPIIIPCHRTIKSNNEIGGFSGNLNSYYKKILLEHEGHLIKEGKVLS